MFVESDFIFMETVNGKLEMLIESLGIAEGYVLFVQRAVLICIIVLLAYIAEKICRKCIVPAIRRVTAKTQSAWDDYLLGDNVMDNVCHLVFPVIVSALAPHALQGAEGLSDFVRDICWIYITVVAVKLVCGIFSAVYTISSEHEKYKNHSLKAFYQMLKLVVVCIGVIVIISTLIKKDPLAILTGLGAGTAILMLVFQDTIKGLVAGIQLTVNDMLRPGDWIAMPKYGADGSVIEVTLTTVKVRNWDNTITTVPPFALVNDSFQNWRGMFESGGRRVKRSINIDMNTVRFCTEEQMENFRKQPWMEGFESSGDKEVNLYLFRQYMEYYLRNHAKVNKGQTMMVRQLQPTPEGLPIELYFFSADTAWINYERLQAEVFDHLLAVLHQFGLKVFQAPAGTDLWGIN